LYDQIGKLDVSLHNKKKKKKSPKEKVKEKKTG
jgi:hypothetical protein